MRAREPVNATVGERDPRDGERIGARHEPADTEIGSLHLRMLGKASPEQGNDGTLIGCEQLAFAARRGSSDGERRSFGVGPAGAAGRVAARGGRLGCGARIVGRPSRRRRGTRGKRRPCHWGPEQGAGAVMQNGRIIQGLRPWFVSWGGGYRQRRCRLFPLRPSGGDGRKHMAGGGGESAGVK